MVKKQTTTKKKANQKQDNRQTLKDKIILIIKLNEDLLLKSRFSSQNVHFRRHSCETLANFITVLESTKTNSFVKNEFVVNSLISEADTIIQLLEECNKKNDIHHSKDSYNKKSSDLETSDFGLLLFNVGYLTSENIKISEGDSGIKVSGVLFNKNIYKILFESQSIFTGSIKESIQNNEKLKLAFEIIKEVFDLLTISF